MPVKSGWSEATAEIPSWESDASLWLAMYERMVMAREIDVLEQAYTQRGEAFFHVSGAGHEGMISLHPHLIEADWLHCHYRDKALMLARGIAPEMFFHSLFCKEASHSCGRQMSAHMSDPARHILSIVGPVGNSALQAVGVGFVIRDQASSPLVLCALGDGMSQQGEVLEAIAHAVRDHLPVLFVIENNRYAISTKTPKRTFFSRPDGKADSFYGIPITWINGRDVVSAHEAFGEVVSGIRCHREPAIVIFDVDRLSNHTNADDQRVYRSAVEMSRIAREGDPIRILESRLLETGVPPQRLTEIQEKVHVEAIEAAQRSRQSPDPQPVFTAKPQLAPSLSDGQREYRGDSQAPELTMIEAIRSVLEHRMDLDGRITLLGEDLEDPKGDVFGLTRGLTQTFPGRVTNSPLSESTIVGMSVGRALAGERPVAFIQFADFLPLAYNQIFSEMGSLHWRSNGAWQCPVILMVSCGGYRPGLGPFHASSLEALIAHTPGIDVFMPSTAADAAGLLNAAFDTERPTVFFYPKNCLNQRDHMTSIDVDRQFVPPGRARLVCMGSDITLVGWGNTVAICEEVARTLERENCFAEVIDLRSLSPWDEPTVRSSVEKTGRLVVVHEDNHTCGLGAEIVAMVMEHVTRSIQVRRVTRPDTLLPCNFENQLAVLPSYKRVLQAAAELLEFELTWTMPQRQQVSDLVTVNAIASSPSDETAIVIELNVVPGRQISQGDVVAVLETNKAIVEQTSSVAGEVVDILVQEDDDIPVGSPIITIRPIEVLRHPVQKSKDIQEIPVLRSAGRTPVACHAHQLGNEAAPARTQTVVGVCGIAATLGSRLVTNDEIASHIPNLAPQDIVKLTGIEHRYWVNDQETALTLGVSAATKVLHNTNMTLNDIDLLLCCCGTPRYITPSMACLLLGVLSKGQQSGTMAAYDINAACSGYLYALQLAYDYLQSCPAHRVMIVTTETLSRRIKLTDTATAPIFGDGASATILCGTNDNQGMCAQLHRPVVSAKSDTREALCVPTHNDDTFITMKGRDVFPEAVRTMIMVLNQACSALHIRHDDLSLIVPHQANERIIEAIRKRLKAPEQKVFSNIRHVGNTSSTSIPLCLEQLLEERAPDELLGLCAFGGGFTAGGAILKMM
ncbi:MAG: beta-ketoacyl-ACP synthase 3 [Phycisphaerae bacterium]|nr:beta-ketoacyl-ACP synthase 3 [Phycisphaerae bacterium]